MAFRQYYSWIETTLKKKILGKKPNHLFVSGKTMSGKTYLMNWFGELVVEKGISKLFIMNCNKRYLLEEQLMYLFPNTNKEDMKKIMRTKTRNDKGGIVQTLPKGYKVKVYVPISSHCPDKLPENFVPFSIAINDWEEENLQILYGDKDVARIKGIYDTHIKYSTNKNLNYADLKNVLRKFKNSTIMRQRGYMGAKVTYFTPKVHKRTIEGFFGRMQQFNEQGLLASQNFPHNLKTLLKEELKDQKTIVILDTEFLENDLLEYFVIGYFTKTLTELLDKEGMKHQLKHKTVLWFDEIRFLFPSHSEHKKSVHVGMSDMGAELLTSGRHPRIEVWLSVQSPSFIPASMLKNIGTKIITHFSEKEDMDWVGEYFHEYRKDLIRDLFAAFERQRNRGDYRFIILEERIDKVTLLRTNKSGWGNRLPRPRLSFYYSKNEENKVPLYNWNVLEKDPWSGIDLNIKVSNEIGKAKRLLLKEFVDGEDRLLKTIKKERKAKQLALDVERRDIVGAELKKIKKVAEIVNLIGENFSQIAAKTGVMATTAHAHVGRARELGLIYPIERVERNKRILKTLKAGKELKETNINGEELRELLEKAVKYNFISRNTAEKQLNIAKVVV